MTPPRSSRVPQTSALAAAGLLALVAPVSPARAGSAVTLLTQQRTITAATTLDTAGATAAAPGFGVFVQSIQFQNTVDTAAGPTTVAGAGRIDCQLNPNTIRARGELSGSGALSVSTMAAEAGEANVDVRVTLRVDEPTTFAILASPRPALNATDSFRVRLRDTTRNNDIINVTQLDAPQTIDAAGSLQPGEYEVRYRVEASFTGALAARLFAFDLSFPQPVASDCNANGVDDYREIILNGAPDANHNGVIDSCECLANWNGAALSTQDIFDFINDWFDASADFNHDGAISAQDIFDFLNAWFAGC